MTLVGLRVEVSNFYLGNTAHISGIPHTPFYSVPGTISAVEMKYGNTAVYVKLDHMYTGYGYASGNNIAYCWLNAVRLI